MREVKSIAECLQALRVLDENTVARTKTQWPQDAKSLNEVVSKFADSIEEECNAKGSGENLDEWVQERAIEWVKSNSKLWSANGRLPHAPAFPEDELVIAYWVQQYVLNKWHNASQYRKKKETTSLPGLQMYGGTTTQTLHEDILSTNGRDIKQVCYQRKQDVQTDDKVQVQSPEGRSENPDTDGWSPYSESDSHESSSESATVPVPDQLPNLQSTFSAIVPHSAVNSQTSHANGDNSQSTSSNTPAANDFRARAYAPVAFQAEMYSRITFLIGPSHDRNGHMSNSYARIMGLEEAQSAETFRAGVFERLGEMGEVVGSRKVVVKPDWMSIPFVVDNDHDHHYLLEALRTWGNWKAPGLSVVYVRLEHEV